MIKNHIRRQFLAVDSRLRQLERQCIGPTRWGQPLYDTFTTHLLTPHDLLIAQLKDSKIRGWRDFAAGYDNLLHLPTSWRKTNPRQLYFSWPEEVCRIQSWSGTRWYDLYLVTVTATRVSHRPQTAAKPQPVRDFSHAAA